MLRMNTKQTDASPESTPQKVAQECLDEAGGDIVAAVNAMEMRVDADRDLRDTLTSPLIRGACYDAIKSIIRQERKHVWLAPNYSPDGNSAGANIHAARSLYEFRLPIEGQPTLGSATKADVDAASHFYGAQAVDMAWKGRWLATIAKGLKAAKTVEATFSEAKLRAMQEATKHD